jgi:Domain of unknown function (DUF4349)
MGAGNRGAGVDRPRGVRRLVVIGALVVVLAAGCATGGRNDDAAETARGAVAGDADTGAGGGEGESAAAEPAGALDPGAVVRSAAQLAGAERSVIRTAELRVEVEDVPGASERALAVVEAAGGFLSGQRSDLSGDARAVLTFKVPPDAFLDVLGDLAGLGELVERRVGSDDVTEQVVDLEGRLAATTASVDRLRALLADAADVPQVVAVEGELARREGELESLTGQLRTLRDSVDLATVTLTLTPPPGSPGRPHGDDDPTFADGFRTGGRALAAAARAGATALGFALPFLAVAAVVALPARWAWRRWGRPRSPAPAA